MEKKNNRFLHESLLQIWDFFHAEFSHEWKKSQIFNKDEYKYLFLPFQLKNKACRFHSVIRMSMSCLLHTILQRHVQCSKYTLI
jgi:5-methylthioribose kinase